MTHPRTQQKSPGCTPDCIPASLGPPHRPQSGRGLRTPAVPVNGGGEWLRKGCPRVLPGRTKTYPQSRPWSYLCPVHTLSPAGHLAAPTSTSPRCAPCSLFPASLPAPELPQGRELNPDPAAFAGVPTPGGSQEGSSGVLVGTSEGEAGDRQSRGGSKKWSTKLSQVRTAKGTGAWMGWAEM